MVHSTYLLPLLGRQELEKVPQNQPPTTPSITSKTSTQLQWVQAKELPTSTPIATEMGSHEIVTVSYLKCPRSTHLQPWAIDKDLPFCPSCGRRLVESDSDSDMQTRRAEFPSRDTPTASE